MQASQWMPRAGGYATLLLEQHDFGKGTSSRSTKLVLHGGVRYLEQGNVSLVAKRLMKCGLLRQNAPHLGQRTGVGIVPSYAWWEGPFYGYQPLGYINCSPVTRFLKIEKISRAETLKRLPNVNWTWPHGRSRLLRWAVRRRTAAH